MQLTAETLGDAWEQSMYALLHAHDSMLPTTRGDSIRELRNLLLLVRKPMTEPQVSDMYSFGRSFAEEYADRVSSGIEQVYSTAERLRSFGSTGVDQISEVVRLLTDTWYTKRAVVSLWSPAIDLQATHAPCVCLLSFQIREGALHLTLVIRSNDAWMAAPGDMLAYSRIHQEAALATGVQVGTLAYHAISYHIYEHDVPAALDVFIPD